MLNLSREQQIKLYLLGINIRHLFSTSDQVSYVYHHVNYNHEYELLRTQRFLDGFKIQYELCCSITNLGTRYTAIYLLVVPRSILYYLQKGAAEGVKTEVKRTIDLYNTAAIL